MQEQLKPTVITPADAMAFKEKQDDFNKYTQDMEPIISRFDMWLSSKYAVKLEDGRYQIKEYTDENGNAKPPKMNEEGREYMKSKLRMFLNQNTYLAEFNEDATNRIYECEINAISLELRMNYRKYGCTVADKSTIFNMYCTVIYAALFKSKNDKKSIYGGNAPQQEQPQAQGLLEAVASFGQPRRM